MSQDINFLVQARIQQFDDALFEDGTSEREGVKQTRESALYINSREGLVDAWTRDGRVYNFNNPVIGTPETMSAAGTAVTLTAPSLSIAVPSSVVAVLIDVQMSVATVIAKSDIFAVVISEGLKFTSGGEDMTVQNAVIEGDGTVMRSHGLTHALNSDTTIVTPALSNERLLKILKRQGQAAEVNTSWNPEFNILKGDALSYIAGPATILIFEVQETTAAEATWTGRIAILPSGLVP